MSIWFPWKSYQHLKRYVYCPNSTKRSHHVNVRLDMDEMDLTAAEGR